MFPFESINETFARKIPLPLAKRTRPPIDTLAVVANAPYGNARLHALLGENEKALNNLEKAYEGKAFLSVFVKAAPIFDALRDEPG